ncbi:hypothetical protein EDD29_3183 [Actinocorallia herbida]|uniref:Uncharacterized protein n=1 Tax=Actinocorallia herbida TaxID=58109 RepID=A0A3N1CWH3_9ACTN|nr:hypothetical protein EDD29_3183 [Actinocorallia herbida]
MIRVIVDAEGALTRAEYEAGIGRLAALDLEVIAAPGARLADRRREIEFIAEDLDQGRSAQDYADLCVSAFGLPAELGVTTYISRGTDDDALGVLNRFGVVADVTRSYTDDDELVTVTIARAESRRVPESRLHTALEAALNCEVRIRFA